MLPLFWHLSFYFFCCCRWITVSHCRMRVSVYFFLSIPQSLYSFMFFTDFIKTDTQRESDISFKHYHIRAHVCDHLRLKICGNRFRLVHECMAISWPRVSHRSTFASRQKRKTKNIKRHQRHAKTIKMVSTFEIWSKNRNTYRCIQQKTTAKGSEG